MLVFLQTRMEIPWFSERRDALVSDGSLQSFTQNRGDYSTRKVGIMVRVPRDEVDELKSSRPPGERSTR